MKRLSISVSRCLGKYLGETCPKRESCARYATIALDKATHFAAGHPKSYMATMQGPDGVCRHQIEVGT